MTNTDVPEVDVHEARRRSDEGALLLDVREEDEHAQIHAPEARLVPLSRFMDLYEEEVAADREVLVICRSGARSARAAAFLRERGVDASNVSGGMLAWEGEGLPVRRG